MACSNKVVTFLLVVALMALVATAVPASRRSLGAALICSKSKNCNLDTCGATCVYGVWVCEKNGTSNTNNDIRSICSKSKNCNSDTCGATCINGVGVCKNNGGVPSCCCIPKPSASVSGPGNNQLPLTD
nr:unnamed protein product [Digitaria exilis]